MFATFKKLKTLKRYLHTSQTPKISNQFFSFDDGTTWFVATKNEFDLYLLRYTKDEQAWINDKAQIVQEYYILLVSTKAYSLSELLPKKPFCMIKKPTNILLHIPHDSIYVPIEFEKEYTIKDIIQEALMMADWKVGELVWELLYEHSSLMFNYSRIFLDVERYKDDNKEIMSKVGMAKCYTSTSDNQLLRYLSNDTKEYCEKMYDAYHQTLHEHASYLVSEFGEDAMIIDLHSYPDEDRWYENKPSKPDICIGFNDQREKAIAKEFANIFESHGFSTALNTPYSGSIKPQGVNIKSVMLEINRKIYLSQEYQYFENIKLKDAIKSCIDLIKI
jgi:N-formylglutamate deformylase